MLNSCYRPWIALENDPARMEMYACWFGLVGVIFTMAQGVYKCFAKCWQRITDRTSDLTSMSVLLQLESREILYITKTVTKLVHQ